MPLDAGQRRRIAERCWLVYDLISRHFQAAPGFHLEFPEAAELAILSGALQVHIALPQGHRLEIREEYEVREHELVIVFYSYVLLPHHLHDEHGRIQSFSGGWRTFWLKPLR